MRWPLLFISILLTNLCLAQGISEIPDSKTQKKYDKAYESLLKKNEAKDLYKIKEIMDLYPNYIDGHMDLAIYYLSLIHI